MEEHDFGSYDFRNDSMNVNEAYRLGKSLSKVYQDDSKIIVGRDHRKYSGSIKNGLIDGLTEGGTEVEYIGLAPTDLVAHQIVEQEAEGGVAVTSSHMPPDYRGLKPLNHQGRIFDEKELKEVLDRYKELPSIERNYTERHTGFKDDIRYDVLENYVSSAVERYNQLFDQDLSGLEVAVDPGNGVGALTLPILLNELGVDKDDLYLINGDLDPEFSGRGPDPTESNLEGLGDTVIREDADLGIALDGDADRAVFVNENGEKVPGDESLAILGETYLERDELKYQSIACSINTSPVVADHLQKDPDPKGTIDYTPVGAVFTAKKALNQKDHIEFGGQPNGHFLDSGFVPYDSGTLLGAAMSGIVNKKNSTLSELQGDMPSYNVYEDNISPESVNADSKAEALEKLRKSVSQKGDTVKVPRAFRTEIGGKEPIQNKDVGYTVIFRQSGNENLVRWRRIIPSGEEEINRWIKNANEI